MKGSFRIRAYSWIIFLALVGGCIGKCNVDQKAIDSSQFDNGIR